MSRLSEQDREALIRSGENMQWTRNVGGVPVDFEFSAPRADAWANPPHKVMPPGSVGDVNSDAKGSGARFNAGKPPYELVPLEVMSQFYMGLNEWAEGGSTNPLRALQVLGNFQGRHSAMGRFAFVADGEQHTDDAHNLLDVLHYLGSQGWEECARVFDYGRAKYAAWNWAKGMAWSIPLACAVRHLLAMARGEELDPESGLPHRGHVFCNIVMLYTFLTSFTEGDDRPPAGLLT